MPTKENVYEVLSDRGLTVHKLVAELPQEDGSVRRQNGMGKIYLKSERVSESELSPDYVEALNDSDHPLHEVVSKKLKKVSGEAKEDIQRRLALPFEGIDEMDEDDLLNAMRHLPSVVQMKIKEYESKQAEPRQRVMDYVIGFGESVQDRQLGKVGSPLDEPEDGKPSSELQTREVNESGPVTQGEGVTGIGVPALGKLKNPGATLKGVKAADKAGAKSGAKKSQRKGRRERSSTTKSDS
jgi:hypothetical protein